MAYTDDYLGHLARLGEGDIRLCPGRPPWLIVGGESRALEAEPAPKDAGKSLLRLAPPERREEFERTGSASFAADYNDVGRFRVHVFRERLGTAAAVRFVPSEIPSLKELGVPEIARDLCSRRGGLVMVAGPAGTGKTTTAAAMIDSINRERASHIVTIEEPVEFVHEAKRSLVHQCEVGMHCMSFEGGLRSAIRAGADLILLGRLPDAGSVQAAFDAVASGCLVLVEVCAGDAQQAVECLLGRLPDERRVCARAAFASFLKGVVAQRLLPRADGKGCVAAFEVLVSTPVVAAAIREGCAGKIASAVRAGARAGVKLLDDALLELLSAGTVSGREAASHAVDEEGFLKKCASAGIDLDVESAATSSDEPQSPGASRPTRAPIMTRRMSRSEMLLGEGALERRRQRSGGRSSGRSRRAAFSEDAVPSDAGAPAEPQDGPTSRYEESPAARKWPDPRIVAGRQVLVVDDDSAMRELLIRMLQAAGACVTAVGEPSQALAEIATGSFDLAMFDILMPEMSGTDLYDRALNLTSALKERVVFVTGCRLDGRLNDRIASRGGKLLRKPFVADELLKVASAALYVKR